MPKYRIKMILANPEREHVTNIAGCRNEDHCVEKARGLYNIIKVVFVEPANDTVPLPKALTRVPRIEM